MSSEPRPRVWDITPPVSRSLEVWPGDTVPTREVLLDMKRGDNITLSTLHATVHLGAHADAPSHYGRDAPSIEDRSLAPYLGPVQLIRIPALRATRFSAADLPRRFDAPRVLIATGSYPDPESFNEDFAAPEPALIDHLADRGVGLVGVDTPSVDLFDSTELPTHARCLARDMAILEGLVLSHVPEGVYELIALPLRLVGFDASPVRAVLRELDR